MTWEHLPNAKHIDRILEDLMTRPHIWADAYKDDTAYNMRVVGAAWNSAQRRIARSDAWLAVDDASRGYPWSPDAENAWDAATDALAALVAWDDCAYILDLHPNVVRLMAASGSQPAILMEATVCGYAKLNP